MGILDSDYTPNLSRVEDAIDPNIMRASNAVLIGAGGLGTMALNLVRLGIGQVTIIDHDIVEDTNLVRQEFTLSDRGKAKVDALKQLILWINPNAQVNTYAKKVQGLTPQEENKIFGNASIIIAGTDSQRAQQHANKLALKYNCPSISIGWYDRSWAFEIFFQIPGVTPACYRCATSSRYQANRDEEIKVSSNGNTIFHSQMLDSFAGLLALAILHRDCYHWSILGGDFGNDPIKIRAGSASQFYGSLEKDGIITHNFFQFKAHPYYSQNKFFKTAFDPLRESTPAFVSYWQEVKAEIPENGYEICPDCQGMLHEMVFDKNKDKDLN